MADMTERTERLDMDGPSFSLVFTPGKLQVKDDQNTEVASLETPYQGTDLEQVRVEQIVTKECMLSTEGGPIYRLHQDGDQWRLDEVEAAPEQSAPPADTQEPPTGRREDQQDKPEDKPEDMPEAL